jgi:hypothetical protein
MVVALIEQHETEWPDWEVFERHVFIEIHILTKGEPMDTVGSKCPKLFGRLGGTTHRPQNSIDSRSDVNLRLGRKKDQDIERVSFVNVKWLMIQL